MNIFVFLGLINLSLSSANEPVVSADQDFCGVYGAIFVETDRRRADYIVFEDENEAFADMLIFKESSRVFADRQGIWYFTENRGLADFTIYYVKEKGQQHFSVNFTDTESFAGCR
ncbi:MAG: DUF6150 family protein [Imperialibacter sp.]|uniref:DUF6150 family protein n=1 Tax=Imperialibacter sp. TaxID=2038411 RepID=UPI0032ECD4CA